MQVGRVERRRDVFGAERLDPVVVVRLKPRTKEPRGVVRRLPAYGLGVPTQRIDGRRSSKDAKAKLVGLDLHHADKVIEEDVWEASRGSLHVQQVIQYLPPEGRRRRERVIVDLVATRPRGQEHHSYTYDLRTYTEDQWLRLLDRSPLRRLAVHDAQGRLPVGTAPLPYQIEVLGRR